MKNQKGLSLVELLVSVAIASIVVVGAANFLLQVNQSQTQFDKRMEANNFKAELSAIFTHPENCKMAVGAGFDPNVTGRPAGNTLNPALLGETNQQPMILYDPVPHSPGPNVHPVRWQTGSAVVMKGNLPLMTLQNLVVQLDRDLTPIDPTTGVAEIRTSYLTSPPLKVRRKSFAAKVIAYVRDQNTVNTTFIEPKVFPIVLELERLESGGAWKAVRCSSEQNDPISFGWSDANLATGDCVTFEQTGDIPGGGGGGGAAGWLLGQGGVRGAGGGGGSDGIPVTECPKGMYLAKVTYVPATTGVNYVCGCTKSGCYGSCGPYNSVTVRPRATCCPAVK